MTRTTPRRHGARRWIGATAVALTALTVPAAHAGSGVTVLGPDGRVLSVGSVVTTGDAVNGVCTFGDAAVTLVTEGLTDSSVTLHADEDCNLVVTGVDTSPDNAVRPGVGTVRPKVEDSDTASTSGAGLPDVEAGALVGTASTFDTIPVQMRADVYSEGGLREYEDHANAEVRKDKRTGALSGPTLLGGWCIGSDVDDIVTTPYANEIRSCWFKIYRNGPDEVWFASGGTYRKAIAGVELDRRTLSHDVYIHRNGTLRRGCSPGGNLPMGWTIICTADVQQ
jgi:hypothetical protein